MKPFVNQKINRITSFLLQIRTPLKVHNEIIDEINFNFEDLSEELLSLPEEDLLEFNVTDKSQISAEDFKLTDSDLEPLLNALEISVIFNGMISLNNQLITDRTVSKIASFLKISNPNITSLHLDSNPGLLTLSGFEIAEALSMNKTLKILTLSKNKFPHVAIERLIAALEINSVIEDIDFGFIGNNSLERLTQMLSHNHCLRNIAFGENTNDPWKTETKEAFLEVLRSNSINANIHSVHLYVDNYFEHELFYGDLGLLMEDNRRNFIKIQENNYRAKGLDPHDPTYYDEEDMTKNSSNFSCKNYFFNVFESILDEGLFLLNKERMDYEREIEISALKGIPPSKNSKYDISKAEGSTVFLAKFLLNKIKSEK